MPGSITPLPVMLDEEDRAAYERLEAPKSIVIRYGYQKLIAELPYDGTAKPGCGSKLVVRTDRGIELGEMLTTTCPNSGCGKSVSRKEMLQYIDNSGGKDYPFATNGKVLRVATIDDVNEQARLDAEKPKLVMLARQHIGELGLEMKLVEIERLLGGERIIFYYTSENWVDFRELVKVLASHLQTRIEMCQVNEREEARLVADYEKCGQHCCCKQFLKVLKPVSMRSAKVQKATLDPQKISGRCGRLMCCLRYEDKTYSELKKKLPRRKCYVETSDGIGLVLDTQILTQLALVKIGANAPAAYPVEEIRVLGDEEAKAFAKQEQEQREKAYSRHTGGRSRSSGGGAPGSGGRPRRREDSSGNGAVERTQEEPSRGYSNQKSEDASATPDVQGQTPGESEGGGEGQGKKKRRRRRRRRRRKGGDGGAGGSTPPGGGGDS